MTITAMLKRIKYAICAFAIVALCCSFIPAHAMAAEVYGPYLPWANPLIMFDDSEDGAEDEGDVPVLCEGDSIYFALDKSEGEGRYVLTLTANPNTADVQLLCSPGYKGFATTNFCLSEVFGSDANNSSDASNIYKIVIAGNMVVPEIVEINNQNAQTNWMFMGLTNLEEFEATGSLEFPAQTDRSAYNGHSGLFAGCALLKSISFADTVKVTDTRGMFAECKALEDLDLSKLDTSSANDMTNMFGACESLKSLDIAHFDTTNVDTMANMFALCRSLELIDLSSFDVSVVHDMSNMFAGCTTLSSLDLSGFDTKSAVSMAGMFENCKSLESLDLSSFDTSRLEYQGDNIAINIPYGSYMLNGCDKLNEIKIGNSFDFKPFENDNLNKAIYFPSIGESGQWVKDGNNEQPLTPEEIANQDQPAGTYTAKTPIVDDPGDSNDPSDDNNNGSDDNGGSNDNDQGDDDNKNPGDNNGDDPNDNGNNSGNANGEDNKKPIGNEGDLQKPESVTIHKDSTVSSLTGFYASIEKNPSDTNTYSIKIDPVTSGTLFENFNKITSEDKSLTPIGIYELELIDQDGNPVHDNFGKLTLRFPVGTEHNNKQAVVYHFHGDYAANLTEHPVTVKAGTVEINEVKDLSTFAIATVEEADDAERDAVSTGDSLKGLASTGDTMMFNSLMAIASVLLIALSIIFHRRQREDQE